MNKPHVITPWVILLAGSAVIIFSGMKCAGSAVSEPFLDAVAHVESGGSADAIGDGGRARGEFQIWATAWEDVNRVRVSRGQARIAYFLGVTNRAVARSFARDYLMQIESRLAESQHRPPTLGELYAAFNCGPSRYKQLGSSLSRCPRSTQRAVAKLERFLAASYSGGRRRRQDSMRRVRPEKLSTTP